MMTLFQLIVISGIFTIFLSPDLYSQDQNKWILLKGDELNEIKGKGVNLSCGIPGSSRCAQNYLNQCDWDDFWLGCYSDSQLSGYEEACFHPSPPPNGYQCKIKQEICYTHYDCFWSISQWDCVTSSTTGGSINDCYY